MIFNHCGSCGNCFYWFLQITGNSRFTWSWSPNAPIIGIQKVRRMGKGQERPHFSPKMGPRIPSLEEKQRKSWITLAKRTEIKAETWVRIQWIATFRHEKSTHAGPKSLKMSDPSKTIKIRSIGAKSTKARCLKITEKVSLNITGEASYVYVFSRQKLIKNAKNAQFGEFLKIWSLRSNSVTRQVSFKSTKMGGKCQNKKNQMRLFK